MKLILSLFAHHETMLSAQKGGEGRDKGTIESNFSHKVLHSFHMLIEGLKVLKRRDAS